MLKAILIGATGLIGKELLNQLLSNSIYSEIRIFTRRSTGISHPKLKEFIINFDELEKAKEDIKGDVLFSVLGTTMKTAGSKKVQYNIDFGYQYNTAKIASENNVGSYVLLSSIGADSKSAVFYSRMKGELDEAVKDLSFDHVSILRPSMLEGNRDEFRWAEKMFTPIMKAAVLIPCWKKYRPIKDVTVAKAMINAVKENESKYMVYESNHVFLLADAS